MRKQQQQQAVVTAVVVVPEMLQVKCAVHNVMYIYVLMLYEVVEAHNEAPGRYYTHDDIIYENSS